jgi:hypothetical protein
MFKYPYSHRAGILSILGCSDLATKESVARALLRWDAFEFEQVAADNGVCATACRSFEEWDGHPQGQALVGTPPVTLMKIGDAPKRVVKENATRPLDGIRVLDLSRVLAGPVCGRTLACKCIILRLCSLYTIEWHLAHGADVLLVTSPHLPDLPFLDADTSRGKRTTQLDLNNENDHNALLALAADADVFLQAYRPRSLAVRGFSPSDLAAKHPGIVYANLSAWGWHGPWKDRRGVSSYFTNSAEKQLNVK